MLLFCPDDGTMLRIQQGLARFQFVCPTCPYVMKLSRPYVYRKYTQLKELDDVLNDSKTWENVDSTEAKCPKCEFERAFFMQLQTRSADEPMTTFYRCASADCHYRWKEG